MTTIILQRFANREYRLTQQSITRVERTKGDTYVERQHEKYAQSVVDAYVIDQNFNSQLMCASPEEGGRISRMSEWDVRRGIRSLDIIDEFRQIARVRKNKGGWGFAAKPTSFTRNARHRLLEAGAVIDNEFGKNCYEVTLTLPGSGNEAYQTLANWTGWMCDRLLREVRRNTITSHWFYVWEWQKRGALHLHFAIAGSDMTEVKKVAQGLEYMWFELLLELEQKTGVELFRKNRDITWRNKPEKWRSHVLPVYKSVAAYFSKYAGKSANSQSKHGCTFYPARWWGSSRAVKQGIELRRHRYEVEGNNADIKQAYADIKSWLEEQPGMLKSYAYDFDLGKSRLGTPLGGGHVEIYYYEDEAFARMQNWEPYIIESVFHLGEFDADMDILHADIPPILRRHYKDITDRGAFATPPLSPHSQPSTTVSSDALQGVHRRQPTLAIRAKLLQFLSEGEGENIAETPTEYVQGSLFDCSYGYTEVVGASTQHNPL